MRFIVLCLMMFLVLKVHAQDGQKKVIEDFNKIMKSFEANRGIETCKLSDHRLCEFDSFCEELRPNRNSAHIYKNAQGHRVANPATLDAVMTLGGCAKTSPLEYFAEDLPTVSGIIDESWGGKKAHKPLYEKLKAEVKKQEPRVKGVFLEAQKRTVAFLKSKMNGKNNEQLNEMIKRVESVEIQVPKIGSSMAENGCELPNAFYEVDRHLITVCPQFVNYPDALLQTIIVHEIAHSFDSCAIGAQHESFRGSPFKPVPKFKPIPEAKNPFTKTAACLGNESNLRIKKLKVSDIREQLRTQVEELLAVNSEDGGQEIDIEAAIDHQLAKMGADQSITCFTAPETNFSREAFADWVATEVQAQKIAEIKDPSKAKAYAFETQLQWMALGCPQIAEADLGRLRVLFKNSPQMLACLSEIEKIEASESLHEHQTHPKAQDRMQKIFLSHPTYRKALGCSYPTTAQYCQ